MVSLQSKPEPWWKWVVAGVISVPVTIVFHELAHALMGVLLGHPNVQLHFASVSSDAKLVGAPLWQQGLVAGAGPFASALIVLVCWLRARQKEVGPTVTAVALFAPFKYLIGIAFLFSILRGQDVSGANFDEHTFATILGIPTVLVVLIGLSVFASTWYWFLKQIPPNFKLKVFLGLLIGFAVGLGLYMGIVGPMILP